MKRMRLFILVGVLLLALAGGGGRPVTGTGSQAISAPVLEWQHGGCYTSWCEGGWYSSPAVADLDGDGTMEVIGGAYTIFILNGEDGTVQHAEDTPGSRVWPGVVVADVDGNGDLEIVTTQGGGYLNLLDHTGSVVWTRQPVSMSTMGRCAPGGPS